MRILHKLHKNKLVKKFMFWKYMLKAKDTYSFQCETIDQHVLQTLSEVGMQLEANLKARKAKYAREVKIKVIQRIQRYMRICNPLRDAFKHWKN